MFLFFKWRWDQTSSTKSSHPRAGLLDVPFGFINAGVRSLVKKLHLKSRGEVGGQYGMVFCGIYGCFRKYGYPQIPKSSIFTRVFPSINHPFRGIPYFWGNTLISVSAFEISDGFWDLQATGFEIPWVLERNEIQISSPNWMCLKDWRWFLIWTSWTCLFGLG